MKIEIKVPSVGESIQEAILVQWFKKDGDTVHKDEPLFLIETDKVTLEVAAETGGILKITVPEGQTVAIGSTVGTIDADAAAEVEAVSQAEKTPAAAEKTMPAEAPLEAQKAPQTVKTDKHLSPSVRRLVAEQNIDTAKITPSGPGGRITKGDILLYLEQQPAVGPVKTPATPAIQSPPETLPSPAPEPKTPTFGETSRKPMSPIRRRIAANLLAAKQNTAMLTTFNEIDMQAVIDIRKRSKAAFQTKFGVSLGFMSFFIKATVAALKEFAEVNASIEGNDMVYHHYYHIGVAVGSERGLVVPVIRNADQLGFAELESRIVDFVKRINENKLGLADLEGGTFTISNGGVYGSLLSTPILNMPQSGILGMHKIEKRPVVVDEKIEIRPMMYVALSYDHRIVDGKGAVSCLKRIKEWIEDPQDPMKEG